MYYKCIPNLFFSKGKWRDFREQMQWKCQSICTKQNYSWAKKLRASSPLTREGKNIVNPILSFWEFYSPVKLQAFKNRHQESIKAHRMEKKKYNIKLNKSSVFQAWIEIKRIILKTWPTQINFTWQWRIYNVWKTLPVLLPAGFSNICPTLPSGA